MKKIFFASATLLSIFCISCNDKKETTVAATDTSVTVKTKNSEVYKAIETGDVSKLHDYIASDAVDHNGGPTGEDIRGGDSIIAMLGQMHNSFMPGMKVNVISQAADGDYLFTLSEMNGTTTANPGMGMPANFKMDSRSVDVVKLKDGKATDHWRFMSFEEMMGMMKMMGGKDAMKHDPKMMPADHKMMTDTMKK